LAGNGFGVLYKGAATGAPPFTGWMILEGVDKGEGTDPEPYIFLLIKYPWIEVWLHNAIWTQST